MFWRWLLALPLGYAVAELTPEELLSAPRLGDIVPDPTGSLALYRSSAYSFEFHNQTTTWNLLNLTDDTTSEILTIAKPTNVAWLGSNAQSILYSVSGESDETELWVGNTSNQDGSYKAGSIPGPISEFKLVTSHENVHLVFVGQANPDGSLYNPKTAPKKYTSGLVYDSLFVRHWDKYIKPQKSTIFSVLLSSKDGRYTFASDINNLLRPSSGLESPVEPFGGAGDFDISPDGSAVAFVSKAPSLNPANHTASYLYIVPFDGSSKPILLNSPHDQDSDGKTLAQGASSGLVFSPDGQKIAYLQMYEDGYEADKNQVFIVDLKAHQSVHLLESWDRSPGQLLWLPDGDGLYIVAESYGRERLFKNMFGSSDIVELYGLHSISGISLLPEGKLLLSISSLVSSVVPHIFDVNGAGIRRLSAASHEFKLESSQVEDFSFPGVDTEVHGLIIKPSNFIKKTAGWPMAFFIHGGPQGAWTDSWSTRWNPALFAEQGYIVVAVNPTGSTGYGQKFTDAIQGQWGGKPYLDLELAIEYLTSNQDYSYIDFDRMAALGASYGGYMINYIQGMPLGRKFKALGSVCHDGVFTTLNQYASEELYFPHHDFEGTIWDNREGYEKWDPARLTGNWATPQMVIHNELDFRLPVSEGIAAFNVLQLRGIPSKFLTFIDENHWVLNPENSLLWHNEVIGWINTFTRKQSTTSVMDQQSEQKIIGEL